MPPKIGFHSSRSDGLFFKSGALPYIKFTLKLDSVVQLKFCYSKNAVSTYPKILIIRGRLTLIFLCKKRYNWFCSKREFFVLLKGLNTVC